MFCAELVKQEMADPNPYIPIPEDVRNFYKIYRPSPLVRAYCLEDKLGTPAHIYYTFEGNNTSGSHKLNSAIAQAYYAKEQGLTGVTTAVSYTHLEVFKALAAHRDSGKSARTFECDKDDRAIVETADLLSLKPIIYAANMDEDGFAHYEDNKYFQSVRDLAAKEGAQVLPICAKLEQDLSLIHI